MNAESGKVWFQVAMFITLSAAGLLYFQKPGTAEYVITVATLAMGVGFMALVVVIARRSR